MADVVMTDAPPKVRKADEGGEKKRFEVKKVGHSGKA